jgi:hypothetical protein
MNLNPKKKAFLVGAFILSAYGMLVYLITQSRIIVMFADIISGLSVIGIAGLMFPLFNLEQKSYSKLFVAENSRRGING